VEGLQESGAILRNDTGVFEGGEISMYYDPMIAKLCSWAADRTAAIDAMGEALDAFEVEGIGHNLPFLSAVMGQQRFRSGALTTAYIAEEFPEGFAGVEPDVNDARKLAAIAVLVHQAVEERAAWISGTLTKRRPAVGKDWAVTLSGGTGLGHEEAVTLEVEADGTFIRFDDGNPLSAATGWLPGQTLADFHIDGESLMVKVDRSGSAIRLRWRGIDVTARVRSPRVAELAKLMPVKLPPDTSKMLLCPMPGVITSIAVQEGEKVEAGQTLATVEAMKMENVLKAERQGLVKRVAAAAGQSLAVDELILEFE
jgi:propionyl-CoA carboxylase alpha chain